MRLARVLGAMLAAAPLAALLPAPAASAVIVVPCSVNVSIRSGGGSVAGSVNVTAVVDGHCRGQEWVTCDVTLIGATQVVGTNRDSGMTDCQVTLSFTGLKVSPYVAVGQVGYSDSYPVYLFTSATARLA